MMKPAHKALLEFIQSHGGAIEWPQSPFKDAALHALQRAKFATWHVNFPSRGEVRETISITPAGIRALLDESEDLFSNPPGCALTEAA
jgi:hypothetical protein